MERKATSGESKRKETKPQREPPLSSAAAAAVAADDADDEEEKDAPVAAAAAAEEEKKRRSAPSPLPPTLSTAAASRRGSSSSAAAAPSCQAERCAVDLTEVKRYHRRPSCARPTPRPPSSSLPVSANASANNAFSSDFVPREQDRDLGNEVMIGKLLGDLDALSGTIAMKFGTRRS